MVVIVVIIVPHSSIPYSPKVRTAQTNVHTDHYMCLHARALPADYTWAVTTLVKPQNKHGKMVMMMNST